ncbi:hypothetical protein GCM10023172_16540 [Hymenobacter ginsengisoli]|uniref:Carboxypeptidase-like regulatory domain-containing protein n=1 Tax=Hymenobacter ginsengisoli TaxID=1051626 RepID=A0ABP8Q9A6_9BACT|nr:MULTISPECIES: carboxypeptidase-like regulatory domain-containing protein [unclassified Hymenobacter]MBO2030801.1 carboxypeptidase-like regulatory domain-containing protein [Hymenobacter sp. BT559]
MFTRLLVILLLTLGLPLATPAQALTGRVVARSTGQPLAQVTVRLDGQPTGTSTDEAGRFHLPAAPAGAQFIFSHLGYQSQTLPVQLLGPEVRLEELSYQIGEVLVSYSSIRKLLLKKWKIEESSIVAVADNLIADLQKTDSVRAKKLLQTPFGLRSALKLARLQFLDDGTFKVKALVFGSKGKWQLDEVQRTLHVVGSKGSDEALTVVELTANRLIIHDAANPNRQDEVYVPTD